jgi:hypothetical protein
VAAYLLAREHLRLARAGLGLPGRDAADLARRREEYALARVFLCQATVALLVELDADEDQPWRGGHPPPG